MPKRDVRRSARFALAIAGCSREHEKICDGSSSLRLVYSRVANLGRWGPGEAIVLTNGTQYLFVRGDCHYWVWPGMPLSGETREGDLSEADESLLADELDYASWDSLAGKYVGGRVPADSSPDVLGDLDRQMVCPNECTAGGPPLRVRRAHERARAWVMRLFEQGRPMTGAPRVAAFDASAEFSELRLRGWTWRARVGDGVFNLR